MGLFRRKNKEDGIELKQDIAGYLVFPFQLKNDVVPLNKKIVVAENNVIGFATRGKVLDYLPTGQHVVHSAVLPNCNKKHKLNKQNKYGQLPTGFVGYVYFINLNEVTNLSFGTYKKLRLHNQQDGRYWVKLNMAVDVKIVDVDKLMKSLLSQFAYIRVGEAEEIVTDWLSEVLTDELQKNPTQKKSQFDKKNIGVLLQKLSTKFETMLKNIGIELRRMRLLEVEMPRDKQKIKNPLITGINDESYVAVDVETINVKKPVHTVTLTVEATKQLDETPSLTQQVLQEDLIQTNVVKNEIVDEQNFEAPQQVDQTPCEESTEKPKWQGWERFLKK